MPYHPDILILGSGTTAFAGARLAAARGARVLMIEQSHLGGTCVNWGCIPSKTLIDKAEMYHAARRGMNWGLNLTAGRPDCKTLMALKRRAVETVRETHYELELENTPNLEVLRGHAAFLSPHEVQVGSDIIRCPKILIATGGTPRVVQIPGLNEVAYLTSYSALQLPCFPKSILILGGGVIALEMGQMFSRFGTRVTILERGPVLLSEFDIRLTSQFQQILEAEGVHFLFNVETDRVEQRGNEVCLHARVGAETLELCAERLMLAIGTTPVSEGIGLEKAGVQTLSTGFIRVDRQLRTTAPGIWAAGDVTGAPLIAPAGAREAMTAMENMLDPATASTIDHRLTPMAVFVDPEFATVGMSRLTAEANGIQALENYIDLDRVPKAHVMGDRQGGVLLCAEKGTGRVLGVQMLVPRAADIIHEATLAIRFNLSVVDLATTVHVYPSISDGLRLAAQDNARLQGLLDGPVMAEITK
ncbi:dihydrolipoyl dehydrogenase family protein [Geopsychrobacter electrodiphilus]|uniref:dihydrolipoyl dehydrogenase family protein n=1 Tax=Geopsychrobacter electrodiphilus TaxID=225196 RepID=UPI0003669DE5|nr:NAD(P)/FAD-dependent oxidoreductase [Geopsychrobacter electrodiphilus]